jgi:hypothetical protein
MIKNIFIVMLCLLFVAVPVFAEQVITSCGTDIVVSDTYILNASLVDDVYPNCIVVYAPDVVIDCQGYSLDGANLEASGIYSFVYNLTVKNCVIKNWYGTGLSLENARDDYIFNNTFINCLSGMSIIFNEYYPSTFPIVENNTFVDIIQTGIGLYDSAVVRNNVFIDNGYDIAINQYLWLFENSSIYNNYFDSASSILIQDGLGHNDWNVSSQLKRNVLGNNVFGGNYYGLCVDVDCNGFCDDPVVINENNTDYLPLSTCHVNLPVVPMSCNASIISATGNFIGNKEILNHQCIDATHVNYFGSTNVCYGTDCCDIAVNRTELCQNGCDLKSNDCKPDVLMTWIISGIVILVIIVAFVGAWMYL